MLSIDWLQTADRAGIDAVAVATGQDWRAIEAGAHAYSTAGLGKDAYLPLTSCVVLT